jgi:Nickel responsive protein SCO4226-like
MPLYMDVHTIDGGVSAADVEKAHLADLAEQGKHDVRYLRYWVDETSGKVFCLVEAPSAEAASTVHRDAHGLVADDVFQVQEGV